MKVGVANIEALNQSLVCGNFDSKFQEFKRKGDGTSCGNTHTILAFQ
jgi:hypothetical protein